ncbi:two-component system, OmpR family, phosphate regulon sensor histidine kinase PhoR [Mucilaginibacter mallensis]|uniref:histidine kinase n=1 Tax=Mucilaginibacter mallensis TaxID=652787 RepID=A0A1H2CG58_MUCMA|nr:HAMP domain-containing sensor histidine kinase [Mucilaginibacter mallensis]SDT69480.1 two-component system, OmpR family, phosphate regulon sensor histidine kinase PhoR [Mucilaginibacter mallensis]
MKKRSIGIIIGLMSFALIGVIAMQLYFLWQSYDMQSKLFDRSVSEALSNVVAKVDKQDAINFLNEKAQNHIQAQLSYTASKRAAGNTENPNFPLYKKSRKHLTNRERRIALLRDSLRRMMANNELEGLIQNGSIKFQLRIDEYTDEFGEVHGRIAPVILRSDKITTSINEKKPQKLHKYDTLLVRYTDPQFGNQVISVPQINPLWQQDHDRKQREKQFRLVQKMLETDSLQNLNNGHTQTAVIANLAEEYQNLGQPLRRRINAIWIDSLLRYELHNQGINLPFSVEILTANNDSLIFSKAMDTTGAKPVFTAADTYQTSIFSKDVIRDPGKIKLAFPQKNSLILTKMTANMATTGGLLFVLIFCFGYTIFSIIRQKKVSEMKTDFINNMTHEFKTPVSTIMIASEALKDHEIVADASRVSRLANIIYEENARLGSHIERVLNVARIEKNDFKLDKKPLDVNEMISIVIDSMQLKLQKHNVILSMNLDAINAIVLADELHFSNLIYNLIDNAIKYSTGTPEITISTANKTDQIVIKVADKGIGMSRDQQTKIFEQFYRIPTGNLHDVKGFGLGLSYVNTIVKRLNGVISVRSEKDKGSDFELKFPLA